MITNVQAPGLMKQKKWQKSTSTNTIERLIEIVIYYS